MSIATICERGFEANRVILDLVLDIQDDEQWTQNVEGYMRGLPKPGLISELLQSLFSSSIGEIKNG